MTNNSEQAVREFFILDSEYENLRRAYTFRPNGSEFIHVIEYSAFQKLKEELLNYGKAVTHFEDKAEKLEQENEKLKDEKDKLNATLIVSQSATGVMHQATKIRELQQENEKLRAELAQEKNYSGETNARLDEALDRVTKLEVENERLQKTNEELKCRRAYIQREEQLNEKIKMLTEALELGMEYFTAIDTPSRMVTLKECELMRKEFINCAAETLAKVRGDEKK